MFFLNLNSDHHTLFFPIKFKNLHLLNSRIIQLPKEVYQYLLSDGIVLPKGSAGPRTSYDVSSLNSDDVSTLYKSPI